MKTFVCIEVLAIFGSALALFDNSQSRDYFYKLSAAVYAKEPARCVASLFTNATLPKKISAYCANSDDEVAICHGYTGVLHQQKAVFLVFRGSKEAVQQVYDNYRTLFFSMTVSRLGGMMASHFAGVYNLMEGGGLGDAFKQLASKYADYEIWITGHGLGGAFASVAAGELVTRDGIDASRIRIITFGQPRVGDENYAAGFEKTFPNAKRVVNKADILPHIPPKDVYGYYHHNEEIWFNNGMSETADYKECPAESDSCSNSLTQTEDRPYKFTDHVSYYDNSVVGSGFSSCAGVESINDLAKGLRVTRNSFCRCN